MDRFAISAGTTEHRTGFEPVMEVLQTSALPAWRPMRQNIFQNQTFLFLMVLAKVLTTIRTPLQIYRVTFAIPV